MVPINLIIGIIIFTLSYVAIVSERINRTIVALFGAALMVLFGVLSQEEALEKIDFNTLGLLIGMMVIISILKRTGVFQYLAIKTAKLAKGEPKRIIVYFALITAVASALLDNVTTILLIIPVTLVIADTLKIKPTPFIIVEIMSANIGGAATLIGDPPNIMIGGARGFGFLDFIIHLAPLMVIILLVTVILIRLIYHKQLHVDKQYKDLILSFDEKKSITNMPLLIKSLIVLTITITGYVTAEIFDLKSASIAIFGGSLLLLISKVEPEEVLEDIEWLTIFFFGGLFVLVGSLESIGVIDFLANKLLLFTEGSISVATITVLWMSTILSSFLDNIPYVATMIPLVQSIEEISGVNYEPVWWALAIGSCLGGNGTIIGASANVVAAGIADKKGHTITFVGYMKIAYPLMILSIIISTLYLLLFY